jgi:hypothetical protein
MTGVIPDTFPEAPSFLNEEIEYLEFESLIDELSERLDASWSYDPDQEVYQIEFIDDEGTLHEMVSLSIDYVQEGFNEGRDLITCSAYLCNYQDAQLPALPELLMASAQMTFSRVQINPEMQIELVGKALYNQDQAVDIITNMIEEISTLASDFRLKLEAYTEELQV